MCYSGAQEQTKLDAVPIHCILIEAWSWHKGPCEGVLLRGVRWPDILVS